MVGIALHAETQAPQKSIGIDPAFRNLSVKPGDDFEEYANGGWRKSAEIPADRASTGADSKFSSARKNATPTWSAKPLRPIRRRIPRGE